MSINNLKNYDLPALGIKMILFTVEPFSLTAAFAPGFCEAVVDGLSEVFV
jgi:hypothetical protein